MTWVLDASAALAWVFEREDQTEAAWATSLLDRLATDDAVVPELWNLEVVNALTIACRRKAISVARAVDFLGRLHTLPIRVDPASWVDRRPQLFSLAREHELTAYDAAYLDLAMRTRSPLATFDRRLARACDTSGVPRA